MLPAGTDFAYDGPVISGATIGTWLPREQQSERQTATSVLRRERLTVPLPYLAELPTVDETDVTTSSRIASSGGLVTWAKSCLK